MWLNQTFSIEGDADRADLRSTLGLKIWLQIHNSRTPYSHTSLSVISKVSERCKQESDYNFVYHFCLGACNQPSAPVNGIIVNPMDNYINASVITYQCNDGFILLNGKQQCLDLQWIGEDPQCMSSKFWNKNILYFTLNNFNRPMCTGDLKQNNRVFMTY